VKLIRLIKKYVPDIDNVALCAFVAKVAKGMKTNEKINYDTLAHVCGVSKDLLLSTTQTPTMPQLEAFAPGEICERCGREITGATHYATNGTRLCDGCARDYRGDV